METINGDELLKMLFYIFGKDHYHVLIYENDYCNRPYINMNLKSYFDQVSAGKESFIKIKQRMKQHTFVVNDEYKIVLLRKNNKARYKTEEKYKRNKYHTLMFIVDKYREK